MPKIKLSALATDIKGKSGGSVFSSNAGGTYFRNNKAGSKIKNFNNSKANVAMATVSQSWRGLTPAEKQAWDDARQNYPVLNKFGEPRIPSAYELFQKQNTTLVNAGIGLIRVPAAKRAFPDYSIPELTTPDLYQFLPQYGFPSILFGGSDNYQFALLEGSSFEFEISEPMAIAFNLALKTAASMPLRVDEIQRILSMDFGENATFVVELLAANYEEFNLSFLFSNGENNVRWSVQLPYSKLTNNMSVVFTHNGDLKNTVSLYIDGLQTDMQKNTQGNMAYFAGAFALQLFSDYASGANVFSIQDLRLFDIHLSAASANLVSLGYVLGSEKLHFGLNRVIDNEFPNYGFTGGADKMNVNVANGSTAALLAVEQLKVPQMVISSAGIPDDSFLLLVLASAPIGDGVSGKSIPAAKIFSQDLAVLDEFDLSEEYKKRYALWSVGSNAVFRYQILDKTTGVISVARAVERRPKGFKSCADLSGTVN